MLTKPIRVLVKANAEPFYWYGNFTTWQEAETYVENVTVRSSLKGVAVQTAILDYTQPRRRYPTWWLDKS